MFFKRILTSLLIGTYKGQPTEKPTECCRTKEVGGVVYGLVSEGEVPEPCVSGCIYQQGGMPGSKYCFAQGSLPVTCRETCTQSGRYIGNISNTFSSLPFGNFSVCSESCIPPECNFWTYEFSTVHLPPNITTPPPNGNCTQFSTVSEFISTPPGGDGLVEFVSSDPTCQGNQPGFYNGTVVAVSNEFVCVLSCSNNSACHFWSYETPDELAIVHHPLGTCILFSSVSQFIPNYGFRSGEKKSP
eukprot:GFUD01064704.1.p1 GENE.GFUD01064704.1~~GFUD01064704.1.p1  ORF type:complete len:244 (-),score=26.40 GFUD01064704.1:286-1017(-)